jgi:Bacterial pre-peptidase C-terminal domain
LGWYSPTGGEIGDAPIATAGALGDTSYAFGMVTLANGQGEVPIQALYSNAVHGPEDPTTLNFAIPSNAVNVGNLAGSVRYNQSVSSSSNANNFYRFNLTSTSKLDVLLSGSGGDADIFLGRDVNADGRTDSTEIIRYSTSNTNQESISIAGLQAGSYYLIVNESTAGSTNYNLALTATATAPAIPTAPAIVTTPPIGQADLLWRNAATGQTVIWNINDTTTPIDIGGGVVTYKGAAINPGADWQVKATGNFGGSRNTDMLWRNKGNCSTGG